MIAKELLNFFPPCSIKWYQPFCMNGHKRILLCVILIVKNLPHFG